MKNPAIFYAVIALGVIAIAAGLYYVTGAAGTHPFRAEAGLGLGIVFLIAGVVGLFMARTRAVVKWVGTASMDVGQNRGTKQGGCLWLIVYNLAYTYVLVTV